MVFEALHQALHSHAQVGATGQQILQPFSQTGLIGPIGPIRKISKNYAFFFAFFRPTQKIARDGPKWGRELFFPTNPDLANILGDTDFDFENIYFWDFFSIPNFPDVPIPGSGLMHFVAIFLLPPVWCSITTPLDKSILGESVASFGIYCC